VNKKRRNALLNIVWGLGYFLMDNKILGIGLLVSLPFLHIPIFIIGFIQYLTYPLILVIFGHILLTVFFVIDAFIRTEP
jgi:hypothetical protein